MIDLTIEGITVRCLVDSGSATTLGDYTTFKNFHIRRTLKTPILIKTLFASEVISEEVIVNMPAEFERGKETMSIKLVNLKNKPFQCIIGLNVLAPLKVLIDFSRKVINISDKIVPFFNHNSTNYLSVNDEFYAYCSQTDTYPDTLYSDKGNFDVDPLLSKDLNGEESQVLKKFLLRYKSIFFQEGQYLPALEAVKHQILTKPHAPIYTKNYRYPYALEEEINIQLNSMLENGIIRPSKSPYNSPLWIVAKKSAGEVKKWRLVVDYRKLNSLTIDDKFPIPNIESLFEKLGRAQYFSTIDLAKGFHQILMDESDIEKTAFSGPNGHYEFTRMPFGLKNAPATFQRMMNTILSEYINKICIIYMDDILVFSTSISEHFESLTKIFKCLSKNNLKIQYDKCKFLSRSTEFLGHIITSEGIKPNPEKIQAIQKIKLPRTVKEIQSFLGLTGYYRKFIKNYSVIASPIIKYLRKNQKINLKDRQYIEAFDKLKLIMTSPPLLVFPDFSKRFTVTTDASNVAIGAVLSQNGKPICFASRTLNGAEKRYHTLEKELLAIVWAVRYFRPYLFGRPFVVQTDHQPLKWLYSLKDPTARVLRWKTLLNEYEFIVEYIKGRENNVADFLSRQKESEDENFDIKSLFENSLETVHSASENLNEHFLISESIVNRYTTQIRIVKSKTIESETLYNKYRIVYIAEEDLHNSIYLTDLFRKYVKKGTTGIHSELPDNVFNVLQEKLISLFSYDENIKFTKCCYKAVDLKTEEEVLEIVEKVHTEGNHRGVLENYEQMKLKYFYPNLKKTINRFVNKCDVCNENKYARKPLKKLFNYTETPGSPNEIVHIDVFYCFRACFLTTIDKFTKLASIHKLPDRNMVTIKIKLQERFSWLGRPKKLIMDNEFNNSLIRLFCRENNIIAHFTTPNSHTGNSDIERLHSTLLEHIRILKNTNNSLELEEIMIKAVGFYNNSIHSSTNIKPLDFINRGDIDFEKVKNYNYKKKKQVINKLNTAAEKVPRFNNNKVYMKNPLANRNKVAKRFVQLPNSFPNKVDIANIKRPHKII